MLITFNSESTKINITAVTDFENYRGDIKEFIIETQQREEETIELNGVSVEYGLLQTFKCVYVPCHEGDVNIPVEKRRKFPLS